METVTDFIYVGSIITSHGDCSHEIKRQLLLGRKAMTNLDSILKSRDITLLTKVHIVKAMVFLVVRYGYEIWTIKKAEHWRTDALNWGGGEDYWESLGLQRSNQSILKEINPEYSLKGQIQKLKLQYFGHLMWSTSSLGKTLMLEKIKAGEETDDKGQDDLMPSLTWWTWVWASSGRWWWTGKPGVLQSMGSQTVGHDWGT